MARVRNHLIGRFEELQETRAVIGVEDQAGKKKIIFEGSVALIVTAQEFSIIKARFGKWFQDGV